MAKSYREFNFDDDIELMNLTYKMNTGNFVNYEDEEIYKQKGIKKNNNLNYLNFNSNML